MIRSLNSNTSDVKATKKIIDSGTITCVASRNKFFNVLITYQRSSVVINCCVHT